MRVRDNKEEMLSNPFACSEMLQSWDSLLKQTQGCLLSFRIVLEDRFVMATEGAFWGGAEKYVA